MLNVEKVTIPVKYLDYIKVFFLDSAIELAKHSGFNDHFIGLINDKQQSYCPIYSLKPMQLEKLKTYIENNLANYFIRTLKLPANISIIFIHKKDDNFQLYVNY